MALARLHTYNEPLDMDGSTYAVIARELLSGKDLYTDLWDHKPPAIYATYVAGQLIAGCGPAHVYLLGLSVAFLTMLGIYLAAARAAGAGAGLCAAAFWAIISADLLLQANQPNTEAFINASLIWALALLMQTPADGLGLRRLLSLGALLALASLYKHVALVTGAAMLAAHIVATGLRRRSVIEALSVTAVIAAIWGAVIGYFAATGRYTAFVDTVIGFNQTYSGSLWTNLQDGLRADRLTPEYMLQFWPLLVPIAALTLGRSGPLGLRTLILFLAFVLATIVSIALPGRFFAHYYQLWLPILCVLAACGIAVLRNAVGRPRLFPAFAAVIASLLGLLQVQNFARPPEEWARVKFGPQLLLSSRAAEIINQLLTADEQFFQWGHQPELYYYTGRRPVGGEFRSRLLLHGPRQEERTARLLRELQTHRPELIVRVTDHDFPPNHPAPMWIMENYSALQTPLCDPQLAKLFLFLVRRDGRLQADVPAEPCLGATALPLHGRGWYTSRDVLAERAQPAHHLRHG